MKKSIADYESDIIALHNELKEYPDSITLNNRLSYRLSKWASLLDIEIHVAQNENTPWTSTELGYPTVPMVDKKTSGNYNVADYQFFINDYDMFGGLCIERKGVKRENGRMTACDLYNSFSKKDNRRRFYAEIERYKRDPRFNLMVLIAECSHGEYMSYKLAFNGRQYNKYSFGMSVASRRATMAKIEAMGCSVFYAGTRQAAVEYYHDLIRQWIRVNYAKILNLENSQ